MSKRKYAKRSNDWGPMGFWTIPKIVMLHRDFMALSPSATKVLMVLGSQFNGKNNGDLSCSQKTMQDWGGIAPRTLARALKELKDADLIRPTRRHHWKSSGARCALYALSWLPVDECPGKDLDETCRESAPRRFK